MKGLLVATLLTAMASPAGAAFFSRKPESVLARVTVYWASGGKGCDRDTRRHKCATGLRLRSGHCAVDPKRIPYGSSVILPDGTSLAAVDTGTAVRNRKAARVLGKTSTERNAIVIDRFFETKRQALAWANSHPHFVPVRALAHGSTVPRLTAEDTAASRPAPASSKLRSSLPAPSLTGLQLPKVH